jgi:hypothetical protein
MITSFTVLGSPMNPSIFTPKDQRIVPQNKMSIAYECTVQSLNSLRKSS